MPPGAKSDDTTDSTKEDVSTEEQASSLYVEANKIITQLNAFINEFNNSEFNSVFSPYTWKQYNPINITEQDNNALNRDEIYIDTRIEDYKTTYLTPNATSLLAVQDEYNKLSSPDDVDKELLSSSIVNYLMTTLYVKLSEYFYQGLLIKKDSLKDYTEVNQLYNEIVSLSTIIGDETTKINSGLYLMKTDSSYLKNIYLIFNSDSSLNKLSVSTIFNYKDVKFAFATNTYNNVVKLIPNDDAGKLNSNVLSTTDSTRDYYIQSFV